MPLEIGQMWINEINLSRLQQNWIVFKFIIWQYDVTMIYVLVIPVAQKIVYMDSGEDDGEPGRSARQVMTGEDSLSKAVSANITRILEDLLKDYDKTERPSYNEGSLSIS